MAEIVATHDAKYAPLFEILDDEVKRREARARAIKRTVAVTDIDQLRAARRSNRSKRF